jgi:hypothetical protein
MQIFIGLSSLTTGTRSGAGKGQSAGVLHEEQGLAHVVGEMVDPVGQRYFVCVNSAL